MIVASSNGTDLRVAGVGVGRRRGASLIIGRGRCETLMRTVALVRRCTLLIVLVVPVAVVA